MAVKPFVELEKVEDLVGRHIVSSNISSRGRPLSSSCKITKVVPTHGGKHFDVTCSTFVAYSKDAIEKLMRGQEVFGEYIEPPEPVPFDYKPVKPEGMLEPFKKFQKL